MRRIAWTWAVLGLAAALPACGGGGGGGDSLAALRFSSLAPQEPDAGTWRTWILAGGSQIRPAAPSAPDSTATQDELQALRDRAAARGPAETANVDGWNAQGTCAKWNKLHRDLIVLRGGPPPKHARGFALVSIAMYDAMVAAYDAKYAYLRARPQDFPNPPATYGPQLDCPSYVSERAAISAAAAGVLKYLFPLDAGTIDATLLSAENADLDACAHFQSDVDAGLALGDDVANRVKTYATGDHGDDAQPAYVASGIMGRWKPTPPGNLAPVLPGWGGVKTWVLPYGSAVRPGAFPTGAAFDAQIQDVYAVSLLLTQGQKDIADFWSDGAGTITPPGHWNQIAVDRGVSHGLDDCRMARVLALLGVAQHDAFVACWECKYFYDVARPITMIREKPMPAVPLNVAFLSYIVTPPFPSYPSGHSTTSGAASTVLAHLFPDDEVELLQMANEAKDSRLFGGIHYRIDNDTGLSMGQTIGSLTVDIATTDGAED